MSDDGRQTLRRRQVVAGAGTVGALAVAAAALPGGTGKTAPPAASEPTPERSGYRLSQHVLRYYQTARI